MTARLQWFIVTNIFKRGTGKDDSPVRYVTQYWALDGELLAEVDPLPDVCPECQNKRRNFTKL